jgi:hypothetical protein
LHCRPQRKLTGEALPGDLVQFQEVASRNKTLEYGGKMNAENIIAIANFLGDAMTDEQAVQLMDEARQLSIADCEYIMDRINGGPFYTEMTMYDGEMGGLSRY